MNNGGDAAEQVVRISLEGIEVAAKITGKGAKGIAIMLAAVLKEEHKTKGKARLTNMIKSGKELKVFSIQNKDLKKFSDVYKRQGKDFRQYNLLSFSGVYMPRKDLKSSKIPAALDKYLEANKETESIVIHFDNDRAGRLSAAALKEILGGKYKVRSDYPSFGKDYNDYLCQRLKRIRDKNERRNKDDREK